MELCLGTVQFGMDYGIRGKKKPDLQEALSMMDYAVQNGVNSFDTASAYGTAENVVGEFLQAHPCVRDRMFITTKLLPNILENVPETEYYKIIKQNLENSLLRLHTDYLDGYYFHTPAYVFQEVAVEALAQLKKEGYLRHVGVSAYEVAEAEAGILNPKIDLLQVPFSILDQRMSAADVFLHAGQAGTKVHTRSAFIQGMIFMEPDEVPPYLHKALPVLRKIEVLSAQLRMSKAALAIYFVKTQPLIERLVFGVHSLDQLKEDIAVFHKVDCLNELKELAGQFRDLDAEIVMPSLWKKE